MLKRTVLFLCRKMEVKKMKLFLKESEYGELKFLGRAEDYDKGTGFGKNRKVTHHAYKVYGTKHAGGLLTYIPFDAPAPVLVQDEKVELVNPAVLPRVSSGIIEFEVYCDTLASA